MEDHELLELAAKAIGEQFHSGHITQNGKQFEWVEWNPLTDDGDALRLLCELRIHVGFFRGMVAVQGPKGGQQSVPIRENEARDPTRRAIVRAAAAIGKEM